MDKKESQGVSNQRRRGARGNMASLYVPINLYVDALGQACSQPASQAKGQLFLHAGISTTSSPEPHGFEPLW